MAGVADRIQANLKRILESIREALKPNLEPDEELRWFGSVTQLRAPAPVRFLLSWGCCFRFSAVL
jgi:hypothetical protein